MAAVVVRNSRAGQEPPPPPTHEDGTLYPYAMFYSGYKFIAYADSPGDLLSELVSGYAERDDEGRLRARIALAVDAQIAAQARINADLNEQTWDGLSEQEKTVLQSPRFEQPSVDVWSSSVPLVLVDTGYAPYTRLDRPISGIADVVNPPNIWWIRPLDEWEFLVSLAAVDYIGLQESTDL